MSSIKTSSFLVCLLALSVSVSVIGCVDSSNCEECSDESQEMVLQNNDSENSECFDSEEYEEEDSSAEGYTGLVHIAHALGGIDGYTYTNCKEAFYLNNIHSGGTFLYFECDVGLSSDGIPILYHDINKFNSMTGNDFTTLSYSDFSECEIYGEYTPADLNFIFEQMLSYDDIVFDLDITDNVEEILIWIRDESILVSLTEDQRKSVYSRLIIEFYYEDDYLDSCSILDGVNFAFTSEFYGVDDDVVLDFCVQNNISFSSLRLGLCTEEIVSKYSEQGVKLLIYTVNDKEDVLFLSDLVGVYGIYTDTVFEME